MRGCNNFCTFCGCRIHAAASAAVRPKMWWMRYDVWQMKALNRSPYLAKTGGWGAETAIPMTRPNEWPRKARGVGTVR